MIKIILIFIIFISSPVFGEVDNNEINIFIKFMHDKHSFDQAELRNLFDNVRLEPRIKKYIKKAPERTLTWNGCTRNDSKCTNYRNLFVNNKNIKNGINFWKNNLKALTKAEKEFGVPAEIIVAIVGIESKYGLRTGTFKTFDTLVSLSLGKIKEEELNFIKLN
jgi:membrane-bound lytic murein transglycosylase B